MQLFKECSQFWTRTLAIREEGSEIREDLFLGADFGHRTSLLLRVMCEPAGGSGPLAGNFSLRE